MKKHVSRRTFISWTAGAAVVSGSGCRSLQAGPSAPPLRIGAISDVHIIEGRADKNTFVYGDYGTVRAAFEYFRDNNVDAVTITGDLASRGFISELVKLGELWREVFPGDKRPDGGHVEPIFVYGNHDYFLKSKADGPKIFNDRAGAWMKAFGRKWAPVYSVKVKGHTFIGMHWGAEKHLPAFIKKHEAELDLDNGLPFFCLQHPIPKNTLFAYSGNWGEDRGHVTRCLSDYPNAVSLSGHTHMAASDDRQVWQGAFTAINCCTLGYIVTPSGCLNSHLPRPKNGEKDTTVRQMAPVSRDGKQGLMIDVWPDRLEIERRDFVLGMETAPRLVVPLPRIDRSSTFSYSEQAKRAVPPAFPAGADLRVTRRKGMDSQRRPTDQIVLDFSSATAAGHAGRVETYIVEALPAGGGPALWTGKVAQEFHYHPLSRIPARQTCVLAASELPPGAKVTWRVTPVNLYGQKGKPLT